MTEFPPEHFGSWQRITTDRYWKQLQSRPPQYIPGLAALLRFKSVFEEAGDETRLDR